MTINQIATIKTFADMLNEIEHYDRDRSYGKTREEVKAEFAACLEVYGTLSRRDLLMIWHIRNGGVGLSDRFARIARTVYDTKASFDAFKRELND